METAFDIKVTVVNKFTGIHHATTGKFYEAALFRLDKTTDTSRAFVVVRRFGRAVQVKHGGACSVELLPDGTTAVRQLRNLSTAKAANNYNIEATFSPGSHLSSMSDQLCIEDLLVHYQATPFIDRFSKATLIPVDELRDAFVKLDLSASYTPSKKTSAEPKPKIASSELQMWGTW